MECIDAGHLLGSASMKLTVTENGETRTIVFSGDIGNVDQPIIRDPQFFHQADFVVMESTYGNRNHTEVWSYTDELAQIIDETLGNGGNVVIPSFAVGRTQELLYFIRQIKDENLVKSVPNFNVYVDSPVQGRHHHLLRRPAGVSGRGCPGPGEGWHPHVQLPRSAPDGDGG